MWVPSAVVDWFHISKQAVDSLREENAVLRVERDALKLQVTSSQNHFDWLRIRVNALEVERAQLIERAYGMKLPVPEIVRPGKNPMELNADLFNDMGDTAAKALGLPVYEN